MEIKSQYEAVEYVKELLGNPKLERRDYNSARHTLLDLESGKRYYVVYKKEAFNTFGLVFRGKDQKGESINIKWLDVAVQYRCKIVFVYMDGAVRSKDANEFKQIARSNDYVRVQNTKLNNLGSEETTYSIPLEAMASGVD